jgi:RNA polymerase III transcription factor (TF)IIIC subunit HTH domain
MHTAPLDSHHIISYAIHGFFSHSLQQEMVKERPLWLRNEVIDAVAECYRFAVLDSLALIGYQLKDGPWRGYYVSYTLTHNCYVYKA